jgi:hypothetical protein
MARSKKHSQKSRKHTRRHRNKKGGYYGAAGPIVPGGDAMQWNAGSEMGKYTADQINAGAKMSGGRRRRKNRKTVKKGGGKYGGVSASYTGTGVRGRADFVGASTRVAGPQDVAAFGKFNDNGAHSGDFGSFKGMFPN